MKIDAGATLRCRPVWVDLGGREYQIPARPAADWMMVMLEGGWDAVVPGMLTDDGDELLDALESGELTGADCDRAAQAALAATAGTFWWSAVKLVNTAASDPAAIGELRLAGVDPSVAPLGAVLAALYRLYTRDTKKSDKAKFDAELDKPPPGVSAAERYDEATTTANFERMLAQRG